MKPYQYILLIAFIVFMVCGYTKFSEKEARTTDFPLKSGMETERLYLVGGSAVKAVVQPAEIIIKSLGVIIDEVIQCESSGRHNVWGDKGMAFGKWQFWENTFYWLADLAGFKNVDWKSEVDQDLVGRWAIKNNFGYLWTCYEK